MWLNFVSSIETTETIYCYHLMEIYKSIVCFEVVTGFPGADLGGGGPSGPRPPLSVRRRFFFVKIYNNFMIL